MSAEYEGKMDRGTDNISKTLKILPRPVHGAQDRIRALNLTGDPTGLLDVSFDDGMVRQGVDHFASHQLEGAEQARIDRFQAIDEAWYN